MKPNPRPTTTDFDPISFDDLSMLLSCSLVVALALAVFGLEKTIILPTAPNAQTIEARWPVVQLNRHDVGFELHLDGFPEQVLCVGEDCAEEQWNLLRRVLRTRIEEGMTSPPPARDGQVPPTIYCRIAPDAPFGAYLNLKRQVGALSTEMGLPLRFGIIGFEENS